MEQHRPHFFLDQYIKQHTETGRCKPSIGGSTKKGNFLDPQTHGQHLLAELDQVFQNARGLNPNADVVAIRFVGRRGIDLAVNSLEQTNQGTHLLNIHQKKDKTGSYQTATVVIPNGNECNLQKKFSSYALQERTSTDHIKHETLCNSIANLQTPDFDDYWVGPALPVADEQQQLWCQIWVQRTQLPSSKKTRKKNVEKKEIKFTPPNPMKDMEDDFRQACESIALDYREEHLNFPETQVFLVCGNKETLTKFLAAFHYVSAICRHNEATTQWTELPIKGQFEWVEDLNNRLDVTDAHNVSVCLLDTGVASKHPLLQKVINEQDCHTTCVDNVRFDKNSHGTEMAGLLVYGDLSQTLSSSEKITIPYRLESVRILSDNYPNPEHLYGAVTQQAIYRVEAQNPNLSRITCMAISDKSCSGNPDAWSSSIDQLANGDVSERNNQTPLFEQEPFVDNGKRLIVLPTGNVSNEDLLKNYPNSNETETIESPGQSWNALTIGAYTEKVWIENDPCPNFHPLAQMGDLAPSSRTTLIWDKQWPLKPDLVYEGGNYLISDDQKTIDHHSDLELVSLSNSFELGVHGYFTSTRDSSAATALVARMAAHIKCRYQDAWPETVRALLINSARWTKAMQDRFLKNKAQKNQYLKKDYEKLVRCFGYGVPDLIRACESCNNSLTLIIQDSIVPYRKNGSVNEYGDVKIYDLPWPVDILRGLGEATVKLHVTLSYFISPNPTQKEFSSKYRYQSHSLAFQLNSPNQNREDFRKKLCKNNDEEADNSTSSDTDMRWKIGVGARKRGSLHSDIWEGTAVELASCGFLAVYPDASGWWKEKYLYGYGDVPARFSLVVSLELPETELDVWNVINQKIELDTQVIV